MTAAAPPRRGEVHLVAVDPALGSRIRRTRPCVIVSPDELNLHLKTTTIAPMRTGGQAYPWRIPCRFRRRAGFVALDQLRTVDRERLVRRIGRLTPATFESVLEGLQRMFAD